MHKAGKGAVDRAAKEDVENLLHLRIAVLPRSSHQERSLTYKGC